MCLTKGGLETKYSVEQSSILNMVILAAVCMWKPYRPKEELM